ncbi:MAG: LuxR C-terminal-related transcriptional regulator [Gammaproteobacteria bacterium]
MFPDVFNQHEKVTVYSKDLRGYGLSVNETVLKSFGLKSASEYIGRTDMDVPGQALYAPIWIENDRRIMKNGVGEMLFELCNCDGTLQWFRSYKTPLFGHAGNVIGITGMSLKISDASLIPLTKQQTACLKYLGMGFTHKQIGLQLGLSQKTVEHYLEAVKLKLNCKSRADLMLQAIERGLVTVF